MASFATGSYTVTRRGRATTLRGRQQEPTTTTLTISGSITPAGGRDLERLPEGRYDNETRVLFTTTALYVGGQNETYQTDQVTLDGVLWEVQHVETWTNWGPGQTGYKCLLQRP